MLAGILDNLTEGVFCIDRDRTLTLWNRAAVRITGYTADEMIGSTCRAGVLKRICEQCATLCEEDCPVRETLADGTEREEQTFFHHRDGHRIPVRLRVVPHRDAAGRIAEAIHTFRDSTTDTVSREQIVRLQKLALLDPLTRLGNRRYTEKVIKDLIEETRRFGWTFGCIFADVDFFKEINDAWGHATGDRLLRMVATTISRGMRPFDFVGRWGGDEFVVTVANVNRLQLEGVAERCRLVVEGARLDVENASIATTVSIGATLGRPDDTVDTVLKRADALMYRSKEAGRNRCTGDAAGGKGRQILDIAP